jgi:hypothetical protein
MHKNGTFKQASINIEIKQWKVCKKPFASRLSTLLTPKNQWKVKIHWKLDNLVHLDV